ncbi:MAG TPA: class I SAM-dependent methyltransferase [Rhizomicrobium sp.]|nr:class I SAM-dependent methyltransferase [Rhizomicrobium sp.]
MNVLEETWNGFSDEIAGKYLKTFGAPSLDSKRILADILESYAHQRGTLKLIELGCGNGQLAEYFVQRGLNFDYTGVDFSRPLLAAARKTFESSQNVHFINGDVHNLADVSGTFDFAIYSHVIELLSSPEKSLRSSKRLARGIIIRFYEPPEADATTVELRNMEMGDSGAVPHPYIRWTMGRDFYRLILAQLGVKSVDIYRSEAKDQVHVLHFE